MAMAHLLFLQSAEHGMLPESDGQHIDPDTHDILICIRSCLMTLIDDEFPSWQ
jgi:hypothetical protein